jgi:hypothetical protein
LQQYRQHHLQSGSSAIFGEHLWVGFEPAGIGTLTLSGGTATVNEMFGLGWNGGTGSAEINAGTLNLLQCHPTDSIRGSSVLDISGGQFVIRARSRVTAALAPWKGFSTRAPTRPR